MRLHFHLVAQIIAALREIFVDQRHADRVIERVLRERKKWGARDRKLFAESVYDVVRWWRWYWRLAGFHDERWSDWAALTDRQIWAVWTAYWVVQDGEWPGFDEVKGLSQEAILERAKEPAPDAVRASIPDWLEEKGQRELGQAWPKLRSALNQQAPVFLRVNTLRATRDQVLEGLAEAEIEASAVRSLPDAVKLGKRTPIFRTELYRSGWVEVQDAGSQRIAPLLEVEPGMRVVDGCAGGGGKTLHLAALMGNKGRLLALDVHQWKLDELRKRARRAGVDCVETRLAEGSKTFKRLAGSVDRLLLDVPCSGLGVLRRNPDAKWKLQPEELERLQQLQREILQQQARLVKPGGKMVYATCSLFPSENEEQVRAFLAENAAQWELEEELHLLPGQPPGGDGFYAARLRRLE
ncbi:MAG: RsmB/NOP family class I SAM-dependent RNA methyltransferase [Verrucomicrobiales bacterium]|nr:RsmB/NOP family class I SAM-dependent RNA methyltransferase [Verrucomicrobiales bacterium]